MGLAQARVVLDAVQHERALELERAFQRQLGNAPAGVAEPALPHSSTDPPGSGAMISTSGGASSRSFSGVPVRSGNVP